MIVRLLLPLLLLVPPALLAQRVSHRNAAIQGNTPEERLAEFQKEVEGICHCQLVVQQAGLGPAQNGGTDCINYPGQYIIAINETLDTSWQQVVLAHELGHAYLCAAKKFRAAGSRVTKKGEPYPESMMDANRTLLGSCLVEPLADREARKRGFNPSITVDRSANAFSIPSVVIREGYEQYGALASSSDALDIFCRENRRHAFNEKALEDKSFMDLGFAAALKKIKTGMRGRTCDSSDSCYRLQKELRHYAGLDGYIEFQNPHSGFWE